MRFHNRRALKARRKHLRNHCTPAEAALWHHLKQRKLLGPKFRRQHSAGPFILDFYCPSERLAVEVDGRIHDTHDQSAYDKDRTHYLNRHNIRVIRIRNAQALHDPASALAYIASFFDER